MNNERLKYYAHEYLKRHRWNAITLARKLEVEIDRMLSIFHELEAEGKIEEAIGYEAQDPEQRPWKIKD